MNVDDLFPDDGEGEDHPVMKLFEQMDDDVNSFFDMVLNMLNDRGVPVTVVDTDQDQSANLSGFNTKEKGRTT